MPVKLIFVVRRHPNLTPAQFQDHWVNTHAPLVRSLAETFRIRRYVQSASIDSPVTAQLAEVRGMAVEEPPDGVAEVWFDSMEDLIAGFFGPDSEGAGQRLLEDEARFVDYSRTKAWVTEERQMI